MSSVSITAVISFACVAIVGVNAARLGLLYHYQKHRIFLIGAIGRLFQAAFLFVMALQFVVLQSLSALTLLFTIPCGFAVILLVDMLDKDAIDMKKLLAWTVIATVNVMLGVFVHSEDAVWECKDLLFGNTVLCYSFQLRIGFLVFSTFINFFLFYYAWKTEGMQLLPLLLPGRRSYFSGPSRFIWDSVHPSSPGYST